MAALTISEGAEGRVPYGSKHYLRRFTFTPSGAGATADWIVTGSSNIVGVLGSIGVRGATKGSTNYVLNAAGTAAAADSSPGLLGVESDLAAAVHEVTVITQD